MADGVNGENLFKNLSVKLNNLYKDKDIEISQGEMQNIFNAAIKDDKDGVLNVSEFLKAAENYDSEKFGNKSFAEKTAQFEEFTEVFNDIGMLDGVDGLSSSDMTKLTQNDSSEFSEFKSGSKIKTEGNKNYVTVENWNSTKADTNDCLEKIIKNNYDLNALGIKPGSKEYKALEKGIMDANENIYGDKSNRKKLYGTDRNSTMLYTNDKVVLPKVSEIDDKNLRSKVIESARKAGKTFSVTESENRYTECTSDPTTVKVETVYNPDGTKTTKETVNHINDGYSVVVEKSSDGKSVVTSKYDTNGKLLNKSEVTTEVSGGNPYRTTTEKFTDENGKETVTVSYQNLKTGEVSVPSEENVQEKNDYSYDDLYGLISFMSIHEPGPSEIKSLRDEVYNSKLPESQKHDLNKVINKLDEAAAKRMDSTGDGQTFGLSKTDISSNSETSAAYKNLEGLIEFLSFEDPGQDQIKLMRDKVFMSDLSDSQKIKLQMEINKVDAYYND